MDVVNVEIPFEFAEQRVVLSWCDVLFGIENGLFALESAIELACLRLAADASPAPELLALGISDVAEGGVKDLVRHLAESERAEGSVRTHDKWLYLVLAWIFERRTAYPDPLQMVEEVCADFDYPASVASFVRYMPDPEPSLGSVAANEARLYERWHQFLRDEGAKYGRVETSA